MNNEFYILSLRERNRSAAMCCVVEFEQSIAEFLAAKYIGSADDILNPGRAVVFCIGISIYDIDGVSDELLYMRRGGARVVIYVFDCWGIAEHLSNFKRSLKKRLFKKLDFRNICDLLCLPFRQEVNTLRQELAFNVAHVPIGVNTSKSVIGVRARTVDVMAYGRQPRALVDLLSLRFNSAGTPGLMYHTDHIAMGDVRDIDSHRRMFWSILASAKLALAYDVMVCPGKRVFPYSIVGQRWFESLAAGCVVVGRRPQTDDYEELLDWQDATIELKDEPQLAVEQVLELLTDRDRLTVISQRNAQHVRSKHDWSFRIMAMLRALNADVPPLLDERAEQLARGCDSVA